MAKGQNLRAPSTEEARERGRKGGKASAAKRAERKSLREGLLLLLSEPLTKDGKPTGKTTQDAIIAALIKKAAAGDTRAFEMIRDTIGEKPVQQVEVATPKAEMADDIAAALEKRQKDLMDT